MTCDYVCLEILELASGICCKMIVQKDELVDLILKQLHLKKESHYLELGETGLTKNLSTTGG